MTARAALAWVLLAVFAPGIADSKCGTGNPPSYDDIIAVMIQREPGWQFAPRGYTAKTLAESRFWAFFFGDSSAYSQYNLDSSVGFYTLDAATQDVIAILRRDNFFNISGTAQFALNSPTEVLSVRRCNLVTKIDYYASETNDAATSKLFADVRALIANSKKHQLSPTPRDTEREALFDDP